jgi:hypothetical protein
VSQYATASELASFLKQDVDTSTANQALVVASSLFNNAAGTRFESTASVYTIASWGRWYLTLPNTPVIAVTQVAINGVAITDYTRINDRLFRRGGFGVPGVFPPDVLTVTYTYGYAAVPDEVKGAVLETAATAYENPVAATVSEQIDDYVVKSAPNIGGMMLTDSAAAVAASYRFSTTLVA